MNDQFNWGDIKVFMAIVEAGSIGKAAERLGATQPTISRRLAQLETQIGKKLFRRTAAGADLTDAGRELVVLAERMASTADAIGKLSTEKQARGKVNIRLPDVLASYVVLPKLADFLALHPQLSVELDCGIFATDDNTPDIAIQFLEPKNIDLTRVPMCTVHYSIFSSPGYIERHGVPQSPAESATHRLVHHATYNAHRQKWDPKADAMKVIKEDELLFISDSGPMNVQAIKSGVGIGALPTVVAETDDDLIPLPLGCAGSLPLNMYHEPGADELKEIEVIKTWLLELFSPATVRWFAKEFVDPIEWKGSRA